MKVLVVFKKVFTVFLKDEQIEIQPGQYFAELLEEEKVFSIRHSDFQISLSRSDWNRGKFFIQNEISLEFLKENEVINQ